MADEELIHPIETESKPQNSTLKVYAIVAIVAIILGISVGFLIFKSKPTSIVTTSSSQNGDKTEVVSPEVVEKTFKDTAEGTIQKKETNDKGEGTHILVREGGLSQTAYIVSSVVDLDKYVGKKVQIWGETFSSTQVGWLMDVGRVEEK